MSIQFEYEKPKDLPLKCFHCPHMKAKIGYRKFTYQCKYNHCKLDEEKKEKEQEEQRNE